jgi:hypothetical protein
MEPRDCFLNRRAPSANGCSLNPIVKARSSSPTACLRARALTATSRPSPLPVEGDHCYRVGELAHRPWLLGSLRLAQRQEKSRPRILAKTLLVFRSLFTYQPLVEVSKSESKSRRSVTTSGHTAHANPPRCWYHRHCCRIEQFGNALGALHFLRSAMIRSTTLHLLSTHCLHAPRIQALAKRKRFSGGRPARATPTNPLSMTMRSVASKTRPSPWTIPSRIAPSSHVALGQRTGSSNRTCCHLEIFHQLLLNSGDDARRPTTASTCRKHTRKLAARQDV